MMIGIAAAASPNHANAGSKNVMLVLLSLSSVPFAEEVTDVMANIFVGVEIQIINASDATAVLHVGNKRLHGFLVRLPKGAGFSK